MDDISSKVNRTVSSVPSKSLQHIFVSNKTYLVIGLSLLQSLKRVELAQHNTPKLQRVWPK